MSRAPLVIIGSGGQGREIHDVVDAVGKHEVVGYLDDAPSGLNRELVEARDLKILGGVDWLADAPADVAVLIGIAAARTRRRIDTLVAASRRSSPVVVHPAATVGSRCRYGPGTVLWPGCHLTTNVSLGRHVHVNQCVTIGHDTVIGDYVTLNPAAAVSGSCSLQDEVLIGAKSCVLQGLTVGHGAVVGAAACVVRDVAPDITVKGVPAR